MERMLRYYLAILLCHVAQGQETDFQEDNIWYNEDEDNGYISEDFKACPEEPQCDCWTHSILTKVKTLVNCTNRNLTEVPTKLPSNTVLLDLRVNQIRSLGKYRFSGYPELKKLHLSTNNLTNIEVGAFTGLEQLEYLSLRNNSIRYSNSGFPPGVFKALKNLEILSINQNFTRGDFRGEDYTLEVLNDLPKLEKIYLDGIPNRILGNVFKNLTSLRQIKFNGKYGRCQLKVLPSAFFPVNTSITNVTIRNCEMEKIQAKSFKNLTKLESLDLSFNDQLTFKCVTNVTDDINENIKTLKLNSIHELFGSCITVTAEDVKGLRYLNLKELYVESNRITTLETKAVKYIPHTLETISIKDNNIAYDNYVVEFIGKQTFSNLRKFIMANQYKQNYIDSKPFDPELESNEQLIKGKKRETVPELKAKDVKRATVINKHNKENEMNASPVIPGGVNSKLSDTSARMKSTVPYQSNQDARKTLRKSLKNTANGAGESDKHIDKDTDKSVDNAHEIIIKRYDIFSSEDDEFKAAAEREVLKQKIAGWMNGVPIPPPKNFHSLDASNMKIRLALRQYAITSPNTLHELNLSKNIYYAWLGPFLGFENLTHLDLSLNSCNYMNITTFQNMTNLRWLDISHNYLDISMNYDHKGVVFKNQGKLETLILSENRLRTLPNNIFAGLKKLKQLDLGKNLLKTFDTDLSHMYNLTELNLFDNQLETIGQSIRTILDRQAQAINLTLNLERNNLKCDCENLPFLKWLSESPVNFTNQGKFVCYLKDRSQRNLTFISSIYVQLEKECADYTPIIVSGTAAVVLVLSLTAAAVIYRYRWNLRYVYYMAWYKAKAQKSSRQGYMPIMTSENGIKDVNISYADEETGFIRQKIYQELEVKRGLKLHLRHRDSPVDHRFIPDNILDAIENSRKTLIVLSKAYLKHSWCTFEMQMARIKAEKSDTNMLCVLMLENVPSRDLPLRIMKIIKEQQHIEYPGDDNLQDCFWDRLTAVLTAD